MAPVGVEGSHSRRRGLMALALVLMASSGALAAVGVYDGELGAVPLAEASDHPGEEVRVKGFVLAVEADSLEALDQVFALYERSTGRPAPELDLSSEPMLLLGDRPSSDPAMKGEVAYVLVLGAEAAPGHDSAAVATGTVRETIDLALPRLGMTITVATLDARDVHEPLVFR